MTEIVTVELVPASEYDTREYGILYNSRDSFAFTGADIHNRNSQHVLKVWSNAIRPNVGPLYGPDAPGPMGYGKIGPGAYVDPHRKGTDSLHSYTWSPQPVVIMAAHYGPEFRRGPARSAHTLRLGSVVRLIAPNGHTLGTFTCEAKRLHDPHLTPVSK